MTELTQRNRSKPEFFVVLEIKSKREAKNWSQLEVADKVGVGLPTYKFWEQGRSVMPYWALIRLVKLFNIKL